MIDLPDLPVGALVAVDTEASGLHPDDGARISVVSIAWHDLESGEIVGRAWPFDQGTVDKTGPRIKQSLFDEDVNLAPIDYSQLCLWLYDKRLIFHNAYYDLHMFYAGLRRVPHYQIDFIKQTWWDTEIAQWVLEPLEPKGLDDVCMRWFGEGKVNDELAATLKFNGHRYDLVSWRIMEPYAEQDAKLTMRLFDWQQQTLSEGYDYLRGEIDKEMAVMKTLTRMYIRGIGYDVERSRVEAAKARALEVRVMEELPFRPATPDGARKWFFGVQGALPHCVTGKKALPSVAECCVRSLKEQNVEGADEWAKLQVVTHAIGTYYDGYADATGEDGRLRSNFNQTGTVSMRFSSSRVNLQAIPHDDQTELLDGIVPPRDLFIPADGYELWEFDLSQAEARVAAKVANCGSWFDIFMDGRDLHSETAVRLFGDANFHHRQIAKRANFGLIYGIGPATFQRDTEKQSGVKLTDDETRDIVYGWRKLYPEFQAANKRAERYAIARGYVTLVGGRQRFFKPYEELHKAFNAVIQGSIAQFVKEWMVYADQGAAPADVLLQIHDSLVVEIEEGLADRIVPRMVDEGSALATTFFGTPMNAEAKQWIRH